MQKEEEKNIKGFDKIAFRNLAIVTVIFLVIGLIYLGTKGKPMETQVPGQTSKSADSILMERLANTDTITSLQDPIDTAK